jgi:queuosine precursor transporter
MLKKETQLFIVLGGFFIANALLAEFIGGKIFSVERTFGFDPVSINIFGKNQSFNMTAGVLLWPVVFIITDIINEYFGKKGVRFLTYLASGLISYAFLMIYVAMWLAPDLGWWQGSSTESGVPNMDQAFNAVFGQSMWIIVGSLVAFLVGQMVDVITFQRIKRYTGESKLWLRATGSTLISQLIDTYVVLIIAFYIGSGMPLKSVLAMGVLAYVYKFVVAIGLTPLLYVIHYLIDRFLGRELSKKMIAEATYKD